MDDIQFWIYVIAGVIYFIARALRSKDTKKTQRPGQNTQERPQRKPVSFEDLLKEFTDEREERKEPGRDPYEEIPEEEIEYQSIDELAEEEQEQPYEEGKTRRFSDEESRRVYEESVKRAEGTALEFKRDEHFKSKLQRSESGEEGGKELAKEVREMFQNPDDAKKAIILGEILNRKY